MSASSVLRSSARGLGRDERGTTLVEFALSIALFLLIFFALLDFGRMSYNWVMTQKAVQMAARMATARPPVCENVPFTHARSDVAMTNPPRFGTMCRSVAGLCATVDISCDGAAGNATVDEIWSSVAPLLPAGATQANLRFRYSTATDDALTMGFLGGPFTPIVTVEAQNLKFDFIHPLADLATLAGATDTTDQQSAETNGVPMPSMSVSLPGEDLALGGNG